MDEIVEGYFGLDFEVTDLKEILEIGDVLGATWFDKKRVCVDSSLEGNEGRFAFTVGHEIGHWQLHRPVIEMEKVTLPLFAGKPGEDPKPVLVCRTQANKQPAERQADQFSARILMPATDVRAAARGVFGDNIPAWDGLDDSRKAGVLDSRLRTLADQVKDRGGFSNVSNQAMCYRGLDLKDRFIADNTARQMASPGIPLLPIDDVLGIDDGKLTAIIDPLTFFEGIGQRGPGMVTTAPSVVARALVCNGTTTT